MTARIISATNANIRPGKGDFREDLYHRLADELIRTPTLNDRLEDIPLLSKYFLDRIGYMGRVGVSDSALNLLSELSWSGNIRELKKFMGRAARRAEEDGKDDILAKHVQAARFEGGTQ